MRYIIRFHEFLQYLYLLLVLVIHIESVQGMGIEPMLVRHLRNTDYKSVGASSYTNPAVIHSLIILLCNLCSYDFI